MKDSKSNYNKPQHVNFKFWKWYLFESPFSQSRPLFRRNEGNALHLLDLIRIKDALKLKADWRPKSKQEITKGKTIKSQKSVEEFI